MDWSKGISASYRAYIVDPLTWRNRDEINIVSGSINKTEDGLRESADITVLDYNMEQELWIRVYLDARQINDSYYGPLFTGLISSPQTEIEGNVKTNSLRCYSVLKPASDVLLPKGYFIQEGANTNSTLKKLLSVMKGIPIDIPDEIPNLSETIIAENGETNLSMADKILSYIGWRMRIEGDGTIKISDLASKDNISAIFDADNVDSLETHLTLSNDWFDRPNVFRAISGSGYAIVKDEDPNSTLSVANRGREIWFEEDNCIPNFGESLEQYARRRLAEEQNILISSSYTRRFDPEVNVTDIIALRYPAQGLNGYYYVSSQTINIGYSPTVSEVVYGI